ncbi:VOC family protein [Candidatus Daviesbacteria bacterium]|nr:VOC family protein [Candidatus Daviesbacteria bacterium]
MKPTLNPYLLFNGECKEAMEFYKSVLGGELTMSTFGESGMPASEEEKDQIIHARLENDALTFMASDSGHGGPVKFGDNVNLSISGSDKDKLTEWFNKLAEGGKVGMPLAKQFWGDTFGMLTDKFGAHWMVNITSNSQS